MACITMLGTVKPPTSQVAAQQPRLWGIESLKLRGSMHVAAFAGSSIQNVRGKLTWNVSRKTKGIRRGHAVAAAGTIVCGDGQQPKNAAKFRISEMFTNSREENLLHFYPPYSTSGLYDEIEQVRRQYVECGRPARPKSGVGNKSEEYKEWENMAKRTINTRSLRDLYWLIFASEELHFLWRSICIKWLDGDLPDSNGYVLGAKRDSMAITVNTFLCFRGALTDTEIKEILRKVDRGEVLLKKHANCKAGYISMEELAKTTKMLSVLKRVIIDYYRQHSPTRFPSSSVWDDISKQLRIDDEELRKCREAATDKYLTFLLKNTAQPRTLPHLLVSRLNHLVHGKNSSATIQVEVEELWEEKDEEDEDDTLTLAEVMEELPIFVEVTQDLIGNVKSKIAGFKHHLRSKDREIESLLKANQDLKDDQARLSQERDAWKLKYEYGLTGIPAPFKLLAAPADQISTSERGSPIGRV